MRGGRDLNFRDKVDSQKRKSGPKIENWELTYYYYTSQKDITNGQLGNHIAH